ncbi:D-lactate dehydrogenase (plasmid) [Sphingomonas paeninsulae]|uniref:Quinone-dependent D-lactate dehydrogenase n=1 Tax=Sphingomonas paeninsulae TaxID=2319844 RepID=A0A494T813_SPHPE|nr:D-lactate dehydrogenase [Sphingomonas paeninsulae]AYJ85457.1 D-lactate dehydrogenase [Sphingomonas paeninsulae]
MTPIDFDVIPSTRSTVHDGVIHVIRRIVGRRHVLIGDARTRRYRTGFRSGGGPVLAVIRPGSLVEQWQVAQHCAAADFIMIIQSANTGLTGGSTPDGDNYDRPIVIINTLRINGIHPIRDGRQVVCLPGATLDRLEQVLKPFHREPHSVIGSSCLGASVIGGVCNNSGGALVHRGPAYTELALYARLDPDGRLRLINHLGIALGDDPEEILWRLDRREYGNLDLLADERAASDPDYEHYVRDIDANIPARFNADPRRLFEVSGSAGRLIVFAVRLDTFPAQDERKLFYIGTDDPAVLTDLRRKMLAECAILPVSAEYLHRDMFDIAVRYGKDSFLVIEWLGTRFLPALFALKSRIDSALGRMKLRAANPSDRILQALVRHLPAHLPQRVFSFGKRYEHTLLLDQAGAGIEETRRVLQNYFGARGGDYFECTPIERRKAQLHRFVAAGAAIRFRAIHHETVEDIVAIDVALPRNTTSWFETLPPDVDGALLHKLYYGHFFCQVLHQDYIVRKGHDCAWVKAQICASLDQRGGEYPAEHNVGHVYRAKPALREFYQELDPRNALNPGIGQTSRERHWQSSQRDSR